MSETAFEGKVRLALHDIMIGTKKNWSAFSEAAQQMGITPEQALASLMARAVGEIKEEAGSDEEKIANYLETYLVLRAVGLLPEAMEEMLGGMCDVGAGDWKDAVAADLGVDESFLRRVQAACVETMTPEQSAHFIVRGLGVVPSIDALAHAAKAGGPASRKRRPSSK